MREEIERGTMRTADKERFSKLLQGASSQQAKEADKNMPTASRREMQSVPRKRKRRTEKNMVQPRPIRNTKAWVICLSCSLLFIYLGYMFGKPLPQDPPPASMQWNLKPHVNTIAPSSGLLLGEDNTPREFRKDEGKVPSASPLKKHLRSYNAGEVPNILC
jgi:hypothetical protein